MVVLVMLNILVMLLIVVVMLVILFLVIMLVLLKSQANCMEVMLLAEDLLGMLVLWSQLQVGTLSGRPEALF